MLGARCFWVSTDQSFAGTTHNTAPQGIMKHPTLLPEAFYLLLVGAFIVLVVGIIFISGVVAVKMMLAWHGRSEAPSQTQLKNSPWANTARRFGALADILWKTLACLLLLELAVACFRR
jgi:Na+-transporting methylmalonyl-CoA/oxaloacetate decarboxylase gamma subunit